MRKALPMEYDDVFSTRPNVGRYKVFAATRGDTIRHYEVRDMSRDIVIRRKFVTLEEARAHVAMLEIPMTFVAVD